MAQRYSAIQILRFVAASFVVVDHAILKVTETWSNAAEIEPYAWAFGEIGVIVFFGISGFIMVSTQYESFGSGRSALSFAKRRITRIVPIYTVATTLEYLHRTHRSAAYTVSAYIKSLLFIPYRGEGNLYQPVLGQGWTLNYEMFFYLVFAFSLCLRRPLGLLLSAVGFLILASLHGQSLPGAWEFYANSILLYFVSGMLIATLKMNVNPPAAARLSSVVTIVLGLMFGGVMLGGSLSAQIFLWFGLAIVTVSVYLCANPHMGEGGRSQQVLEKLGDASYSTYLFHGFLVGAMTPVAKHVPEEHPLWIVPFVIACVASANVLGWLAFKYIEHPLARWFHRRPRVRAEVAALG
jgi:exopolysaccharide production protein ExoZ